MPPLYNEADTRAKLIDPRLKLAGWGETHIEREHYFTKGKAITQGRIYLVGEESRRREPRRVDYLLRYQEGMIAVIEAKDESHSVGTGLEQAKSYARLLDVPFAYSSNGHGFVEFDFFTNTSREIPDFPTPDELWLRWQSRRKTARPAQVAETKSSYPAPARSADPLLYPLCSPSISGKEAHYYQEIAIRRVIERAVAGQRRILLTMATGTGKTFTAFQTVWKLKKSGWLRKPVLFIADRVALRNQAFNAFAPFASGQSDPRSIIDGGKFNPNRDLYFALYQALDSEQEGQPLYKTIPPDFFGLIVVDECHRSGFGKWNAILQHFPQAIQLGMTATPKQDESIDTYAYFCAEEPSLPLDPDQPDKGSWKAPAYTYSLGQGIEDGFLATYKVHRVRTSLDKDGLRMNDAYAQGAEIYVPEEAELRDIYQTPQFEREISLPDRTREMTAHLAGLLRRFGPTEKTMVFCVDMEHARLVSQLLQNHFADLGFSNYAVPIISEEFEALTWLEQFQDSDRKTPIVATTAELLSTGVDVPACRNIVFMKMVASPIMFKQIIGRGSRVDRSTGKDWFRIIDYTGATRLFDEWDRPPGQPPEDNPAVPRTSALRVSVTDGDSGLLVVGAGVSLLVGPNRQLGPFLSDEGGQVEFEKLAAGNVRLMVRANGYRSRSVTVQTLPDVAQSVTLELKALGQPAKRIEVRGLTVTIVDEATFLVEATGQRLTLAEYLDYTRSKVIHYTPDWASLYHIWTNRQRREEFLDQLESQSVQIEVLAEVLTQPRADQFDLLAHLAFDQPVHTRDERTEAFINYQQAFLTTYAPPAREVILALLDKYRQSGIGEMSAGPVFRLSPFREMGQLPGVGQRFGGPAKLRATVDEMQKRLYLSDQEG